jgi:hypothetical protein
MIRDKVPYRCGPVLSAGLVSRLEEIVSISMTVFCLFVRDIEPCCYVSFDDQLKMRNLNKVFMHKRRNRTFYFNAINKKKALIHVT